MSMFDNVMLDEFTMLDEGKQAEEYKKKKEIEKNREHVKDFNRAWNYTTSRMNDKEKMDDLDRKSSKALRTSDQGRALDKIKNNYQKNKENPIDTTKGQKIVSKGAYAVDAFDRHQRRHPKTESALMLIAGYESEFAY